MGQACAQLPHDSQPLVRQPSPKGASITVRGPCLAACSVRLPTAALQVPTQRWQAMQSLGSKDKNGLASWRGRAGLDAEKGVAPTPQARQTACSSQAPFLTHEKQ